jgi:hypothetical protein
MKFGEVVCRNILYVHLIIIIVVLVIVWEEEGDCLKTEMWWVTLQTVFDTIQVLKISTKSNYLH